MSNIKMVRIDYRMVHGQVVAKWIKFRPVDRLILADNELVNDDFMGDIYKMAVPGKEVDIVRVEDVKASLDKKDDTVMLIFKDVESAYNAYKNGLELPELNVGAIPNSKDRKTVMQGVALSINEFKMLMEMKNSGLNVFMQPIPETNPVELNSSIENKLI